MPRQRASISDRITQLLTIAETSESDEAIAAFLLAKRLMAKHRMSFQTQLLPADEWPYVGGDDTDNHARLTKVLGLTDSDKDGESIAAFLMAVRLMKRLNLSFGDILSNTFAEDAVQQDAADMRLYRSIEIEMMSLKNRLTRLQSKLASQDGELKRYRAAFNELMDASWSLQGRNADPDGQPVYN